MSPLRALPAADDGPARPDRSLEPEALAGLSDDEVRDQVTTWAGRVAAGEARMLAYLGELDRREAWVAYGILSCAHWVTWRLGLGSKAAHERVRVARALRSLPLTRAEHAAGRLSFTQVRAITRTATPDDEHTWVSLARHSTGRQIETLARGVARARHLQRSAEGADASPPSTPVRTTVGYDIDGSLRITVRLPAEQGAVVLAALEAARTDLDADAAATSATADATAPPEPRRQPPPESSAEDCVPAPRADQGAALLHLARAYLRRRARTHPGRSRRDHARLVVAVDPLSGWARLADGELLPPGTPGASLPTTDLQALQRRDLTAHDAGRRRREPDQALRDLLATVDGERCRYPSCTRRRRLHAHHVRHWAHGGATDLANLVLLCSRHHTLVHRDRFRLELHPVTRCLVVTSADGRAVRHRLPLPWRPAVGLDRRGNVDATTLPPVVRDRLHLHYAVSVLLQQAA